LKGAPRAAAFELDCIYSASYIGLLLPYLWVFGIETQLLPRFVGLLCLLSSVISAIALVLTLSRGALLATVLVLILYMFFKLPTKPKQVLMTLLFLLFILALIFTIPHAVERINISGMVQERSSIQSIEERYRLWHSSIKMFLDYPAFGIGFGQFQNMYSTTYALPEAINKSLTVAHNNFLQFLSETGLVGFTGFLSLTGYCLYSFVKLTQRTCQNPWCLSALLMTCSFVFFHGLTDSTFLFSPVGRLYWFLMGISYCQIHLLNIE
ncbi:MAG: O-Antigen ligase, partial [Pelosinus sp.]|nr:O-Antigen ligase [Pelosinus sp.]